jgi:hypothetical protein
MILREIVHSCSNHFVAKAALASIGGDFARRVARIACDQRMPTGVFVAATVKNFSREADDDEWDGLVEALRGADLPILTGLRYIVDRGLRKGERPLGDGAGLGGFGGAALGPSIALGACSR